MGYALAKLSRLPISQLWGVSIEPKSLLQYHYEQRNHTYTNTDTCNVLHIRSIGIDTGLGVAVSVFKYEYIRHS